MDLMSSTFFFHSKTKKKSLKPDPKITTVYFRYNYQIAKISNIDGLFPNATAFEFEQGTKVRQIKTVFPDSLKEIRFAFLDATMDFTGCTFPPVDKLEFWFTCVSNFKSLMSILPLVTRTHLEIAFRESHPAHVPSISSQKEYDDTLAYVIQTHQSTGSFIGYPIDNFWRSGTYRALWVNQTFEVQFFGATADWRNTMFAEQSSLVVFLSVNHFNRLAAQTAIKKLPKDLLLVLASFLI